MQPFPNIEINFFKPFGEIFIMYFALKPIIKKHFRKSKNIET